MNKKDASMTATPLRLTMLALAALTVSACNREVILPGERLDPLAVFSPDGPAVEGPAEARATALSLPAPRANAEWTGRAANPAHDPGHLALGAGTSRIWTADIGQGNDRRHRITADPVVAGGRVFTMDSRARVSATALSGGTAWSRDLTPAGERGDSVSGGGIAYEAGRIFVTTGYGELIALDAASGQIQWRQRLKAPVGGGPVVAGGVVYLTSRDFTGWAVRASDGKVLWQVAGSNAMAGVTGVSTPALRGKTVIFPFASGELLAADAQSGDILWQAQVAGTRTGRAIAVLRDMTGDPVIAGNRVYSGSSSGRIDTFDLASGTREWSAKDGANSPVVVAGGSVFAINDQAQLIRLDAGSGAVIWRIPLPYFTDEKIKKQDRIYAHYGPVLAGGKLIVTSSDGALRAFDPGSGALVGAGEIPGGAAAAPAVAGQTLYVVTRDGQLSAYR